MKKISVPAGLWYENSEMELAFPDKWDVDNLTSPGFDKPGMSPEEIRARIMNPVEGPSLAELAKGKKQAVIVFDDMTRPTPVKDIAPVVLEILHGAGMKKDQIRFIWALGSHGSYDMINARKKLGDEIVENYTVYNHDAFQNTVRVGRTPTGVELFVNREVMDCDLKIGIGCITAHVHVGFGGGAKLFLPGVCGIETINQFHNRLFSDPMRTGLGNFDNNILRAECDAAGDLIGIDFKVDALINGRGEVAGLYAGDFRATHAQGAEEGKEHYGIPYATGYDIAVCNAYGKSNESAISLLLALMALKGEKQGTAVLLSIAPEGQVPHYVMRGWGTNHGGRHYQAKVAGAGPVSAFMKRLIVMAPWPDRTMLDLICHNDDATVVKTWPEVLELLDKDYPGEARVGVIQDGTMQYMRLNL